MLIDYTKPGNHFHESNHTAHFRLNNFILSQQLLVKYIPKKIMIKYSLNRLGRPDRPPGRQWRNVMKCHIVCRCESVFTDHRRTQTPLQQTCSRHPAFLTWINCLIIRKVEAVIATQARSWKSWLCYVTEKFSAFELSCLIKLFKQIIIRGLKTMQNVSLKSKIAPESLIITSLILQL